jgi:hypothetical protein
MRTLESAADGLGWALRLSIGGFGMAAGNSPHPLQNIGAGLLEGATSIQEQRVAGPDMTLKSAQAQEAQANAQMARVKVDLFLGAGVASPYQGNANPSPQAVAGALDNVVGKAAAAVKSPQNAALAPAANVTPAAPAAASSPNASVMSPEVKALHDQYQAQVATIDQQIATVQQNLQTYQTPQMQRLALIDGTVANSRNTLLNQLSALQERRLGYVTADPYSHIVQTSAETAARTANEPAEYTTVGPQGSTVTRIAPRGQVMAGAAPGMGGAPATPQAPATEGGRYDPTSESLVPTEPPAGQGVTKMNLTKAQEDKLANDAAEVKDYRETAANAPTTIIRSQQLSDIIHRLQTGAGTEAVTDLTNWARSAGMGFLIPERFNPTDAQELNKLTTSLVFEQLKAIGGRPMVSEIQGLQKSNANLALTNEANLAILANIQSEAKYVKDRYLNASAVFSKYGQLGNFDQRYLENSPIGAIYADTKRIVEGAQGEPPVPGAIFDKGQWKVKVGSQWYTAPQPGGAP